MKRGALTKERSRLINLWVPQDFVPLVDQAVQRLDTDRSKFIRAAMREKLLRAGVRVPVEVAE